MKNKVAVVIPNWNGQDYIADCLISLQKQITKHHIIVVDNGSVDSSIEIIKKQFPAVELLVQQKNLGFAGGVNVGINKAITSGFEYIALFNNDAVADKNWLGNLVDVGDKHTGVGIITGKFMQMDKKHIDSTGDMYSTVGMPFPRGRNQVDKEQFNKAEYVFGGTGGASLYKTKMLQEIGLFDKDFFAYFEDVDISFRAQLAGWKVRYEPRALSYHHVSATTSKLGGFSRYHSTKNFVMLFNKNMPRHLYWKYKPLFFYGLLRMLGGALRDKHLGSFIKGLSKAIALTPSTYKKRQIIQSNIRVGVSYIDGILYKGTPPKIPKIN